MLVFTSQQSEYCHRVVCNLAQHISCLMHRPIIQTYKSAYALANSGNYNSLVVTREEYNEGGSNACRRKFRDFDWDPIKDKNAQASRSTRKDRLDLKELEESEGVGSDDEVQKPSRSLPRKRQKAVSTRPKRDLPRGK
jgi:actin-related protein 6